MQQVNLYLDSLKPQKVYLSLAHMLVLLAGVSLILAGLSVWLVKDKTRLQNKLSSKQAAKEQIVAASQALEIKVKGIKVDASLVNLNNRLKKRVELNKQLEETLDGLIKVNQGEFSDLMLALSRQYLSGISISSFSFSDGGKQIVLEGKTRSADKVPEYLQRLRNEPLFVGRSFKTFTVERVNRQPYQTFYLSTEEPQTTNPLERFLKAGAK